MMQLRDHVKWAPVKKAYYNKYHNVVRLKVTRSARVKIPTTYTANIDYRVVDRYEAIEVHNTAAITTSIYSVYTNSLELMDYLICNYDSQVEGVESPYNNKHIEYLNDPHRNIIYRDTPWYKTYHHKLNIFESWRTSTPRPDHREVLLTLQKLFTQSDSRWSGQVRDYTNDFSWLRSRYFSYPIIYTNNEPSIMLFKLHHGSELRMNTETIVTSDFLK